MVIVSRVAPRPGSPEEPRGNGPDESFPRDLRMAPVPLWDVPHAVRRSFGLLSACLCQVTGERAFARPINDQHLWPRWTGPARLAVEVDPETADLRQSALPRYGD